MSDIIGWLLFGLIVIFLIAVNIKTRLKIQEWASKNNLKILKISYFPWSQRSLISGGFHPANFRVYVEDHPDSYKLYKIRSDGFFLYNDKLTIIDTQQRCWSKWE